MVSSKSKQWARVLKDIIVKYFFSLFLILVSSLYASSEAWQTVYMPNICTFKIPNSMEIQSGAYKNFSDKLHKEILELPVDPTRVVVQQKHLNNIEKKAFKSYARIIVETDYGKKGDYEKISSQLTASKFELIELNGIYRQSFENEFRNISAKGNMIMKIVSWFPLELVSINGISMINIKYTRTVNNGPEALVNMYIIHNDDRMHTITISYRMKNMYLYKDDLAKVIDTFHFYRR